MKCPACGADMMSGFLQSGNRMAFNEQIHRLSLLPKDVNDVMIVNNSVCGSVFSGSICKDCHIIIFDYSKVTEEA